MPRVKLKVGDLVKVTKLLAGYEDDEELVRCVGFSGIVCRINTYSDPDDNEYKIRFFNGDDNFFYRSELRFVKAGEAADADVS